MGPQVKNVLYQFAVVAVGDGDHRHIGSQTPELAQELATAIGVKPGLEQHDVGHTPTHEGDSVVHRGRGDRRQPGEADLGGCLREQDLQQQTVAAAAILGKGDEDSVVVYIHSNKSISKSCAGWLAQRSTICVSQILLRSSRRTMDYKDIRYATDDGVATITLHRPDKLNAFTPQMIPELVDAFDRVDADDAVRAVIVTGAGRAFCAGADLSAGDSSFDPEAWGEAGDVPRDGGGRVTLRIFDCKKPVIAAVNGPAVGIGATLQLPMDVRLASTEARFGFVFARRGITPEACSSWFLPRVVGISRALEWVLSGRVFGAEEALEGGLVRSLHPPDELLPAAQALAREFGEKTSGVAVALARQMLWKMLGADHPMEAHRVDSRAIWAMGQSPDCREGVASFLEKRPPAFPMKPSRDMPEPYPWWPDRQFEPDES